MQRIASRADAIHRSPHYGRALIAVFILVLGAGALWFAPRGADAWPRLMARDDPAALTALGLKDSLTPAHLVAEMRAALDAGDIDLAQSFAKLAEQERMAVPPDLSARLETQTSTAASALRGVRDFIGGARSGTADSGAGLAGVVASDLTGVGDVRDLVSEGRKMARGEEPDRLVLGLATAGLAITGATIVSLGAAMPARAGATAIKTAAKTGRLSRPLAARIGRLVGEAVDPKAATAAASAAARFELVAARQAAQQAVRPAALKRLGTIASDVAMIGRRGGVRTAQEALAVSRSGAELGRVARLAEVRGGATRAVLKVLGRGAIVLTSGALILAGWVFSAVTWLWLALLVMLALARRFARIVAWGGRKALRAAR
ncbi:MAG: hypothetical protein AB7J19_06435 [Beijerinckiaceae bacterium]